MDNKAPVDLVDVSYELNRIAGMALAMEHILIDEGLEVSPEVEFVQKALGICYGIQIVALNTEERIDA